MATIAERLAHLGRRRSSAAEWCQKLALFSVPYLAIVILGHRSGIFETISTLWLLAIGIAIVLASILFGLRGFYDLWMKGDKGGLNSARGMALALLMLSPFIFFSFKVFALPPLYDVSTDLDDPPQYENALDDRSELMNVIEDPGEAERNLQLNAYPRVVARRYPLGAGRVFTAVAELVRERDWTILTSDTAQGQAPIDDEGSALVAKPVVDSRGRPLIIPLPKFRPRGGARDATGFAPVEVSPIGRTTDGQTDGDGGAEALDERYIEAVATSLIFGFESDVVVRIIEEEEGTLVDMRSNSRWGPHDLGSNAARIIEFMEELDLSLQGLNQ